MTASGTACHRTGKQSPSFFVSSFGDYLDATSACANSARKQSRAADSLSISRCSRLGVSHASEPGFGKRFLPSNNGIPFHSIVYCILT